jgi:hypothetical protein
MKRGHLFETFDENEMSLRCAQDMNVDVIHQGSSWSVIGQPKSEDSIKSYFIHLSG